VCRLFRVDGLKNRADNCAATAADQDYTAKEILDHAKIEMGEPPEQAAEVGGNEVALAVLAATLTTDVVFFPVVFLYGVSKFLFTALALGVVISLSASFFVARTVVPLFCTRFVRVEHHPAEGEHRRPSLWERFNEGFNRTFGYLLNGYERSVRWALRWPLLTTLVLFGAFVLSLALYPTLGLAFFPRTDAGQFTINLKAPTGTRIEVTEQYVGKVEDLIKQVVSPHDFHMVVSNIGIVPDFSALYTSNAGMYTATVQVALTDSHKVSSFDYMDRVRKRIARDYPELRTFFSSGSLVDSVLNMGMPAPIDVQVSGMDLGDVNRITRQLADQIRPMPGVEEAYTPQDVNYPAVRLDVDRVHASELGLDSENVVNNVITALNSNLMIAPNYWVDRKTGNDYFLTVQYYETGQAAVHSFLDLKNIPLRGLNLKNPTTLDTVVKLTQLDTPTEVDHYQIQRVMDVYVTPTGEDLGHVAGRIDKLLKDTKLPEDVRINVRGMGCGRNPDGCTRCPKRHFPKQRMADRQ
jgi:multidrug efflux pump subunit AcrB